MDMVAKQVREMAAVQLDLGSERIPGGTAAYERLATDVWTLLLRLAAASEASRRVTGSELPRYLLQIASLECAAGAAACRCRAWFRLLARLAAAPDGQGKPVNALSAVIYEALSAEFYLERSNWPDEIPEQSVPDRIVYGLATNKELVSAAPPNPFGDENWIQFQSAVKLGDAAGAAEALAAIADWWLSDFDAAGQSRFDLAEFPCFEPLPNAALALAYHKFSLNIEFSDPKYQLFYVAAMLR